MTNYHIEEEGKILTINQTSTGKKYTEMDAVYMTGYIAHNKPGTHGVIYIRDLQNNSAHHAVYKNVMDRLENVTQEAFDSTYTKFNTMHEKGAHIEHKFEEYPIEIRYNCRDEGNFDKFTSYVVEEKARKSGLVARLAYLAAPVATYLGLDSATAQISAASIAGAAELINLAATYMKLGFWVPLMSWPGYLYRKNKWKKKIRESNNLIDEFKEKKKQWNDECAKVGTGVKTYANMKLQAEVDYHFAALKENVPARTQWKGLSIEYKPITPFKGYEQTLQLFEYLIYGKGPVPHIPKITDTIEMPRELIMKRLGIKPMLKPTTKDPWDVDIPKVENA